MPDYKKKKHSRIFNAPAKTSKKRINKDLGEEKIKMTPKSSKNEQKNNLDDMRVVRGRKAEQKRKNKIILCVFAVVLAAILIIQLFLPVGIIETVSNVTALIGSGSYPIELSSTSVQDAVSKGNYYYVLTVDSVTAYSNMGEELFSYAHGFEFPVIKVSDSRAIVFNQGGNDALIFNLRGIKETVKTENAIITAAVSDSGGYAIATDSEKYTGEVKVYGKNGNVIYEWYSAEEIINNIALSSNGKKLAVSTFSSANGIFNSTVFVLTYKTATPEFKEKFDDTLVYSIDTSHSVRFSVVTDSAVTMFNWSNYKRREYSHDYSTAFFRAGKSGYVSVFNRESDRTDNRISLYSKTGKSLGNFEFHGIISDIQVFGNHIYCMSDTDIFLLSKEGEILKTASCSYGTKKIMVAGSNSVLVVSDNMVERIKFDGENKK